MPQLINRVMPSFLQRIINISNLYHPNQHLPHLFRDLKFGAQRGDQTPPLVFHSTVLHDSNHYKVDKTFRQSPEEGKTEQNKSLPWVFFPSLQGPSKANSCMTRGRAQEHLSWQAIPALRSLPSSLPFMCCLGLCLLKIHSCLSLLKDAQPLRPAWQEWLIILSTLGTKSHHPHTDKYTNSRKSPKRLNFQRFYICIYVFRDAQGQRHSSILAVILENPPGEQHSSLELSFIYSYLSRSLHRAAE